MQKYVVFLNNVNQIDFYIDRLARKCETHFGLEFSVYESLRFAWSTGYTKTVYDEIDFVLKSHSRANKGRWRTDEFISAWGFEDYLEYDLWNLSGGWRKFLGLALFTNYKSEGKLYFDATRHISSNLLKKFIFNLAQCGNGCHIFFEYDVIKLVNMGFTPLFDYSEQISLEKWDMNFIGSKSETNYDKSCAQKLGL